MSVRVCEGELSRAGKEHGLAQNAVCAVEFTDGAQKTDGDTGMSASVSQKSALMVFKSNLLNAKKRCHVERLRMKLCNLKTSDSLQPMAAGYSNHP